MVRIKQEIMKPILSKCIKELQSDKPRIDYVLGMLETLCDMDETPAKEIKQSKPVVQVTDPEIPPVSNVEEIKRMANISLQ